MKKIVAISRGNWQCRATFSNKPLAWSNLNNGHRWIFKKKLAYSVANSNSTFYHSDAARMRKGGVIKFLSVIRLPLYWFIDLKTFPRVCKGCYEELNKFPIFQSKNLFNSAANCALSNKAFTIFSVLESVDQSNRLALQTSHWQGSTVCIKPLKPSWGIIAFERVC